MAILSDNTRKDIWADFMRKDWDSLPLKATLRAVVDGLDDWLESQSVAFAGRFSADITEEMRLVLLLDIVRERLEVLRNG